MSRDYLALITSEHRLQPRFAAAVALLTGAAASITNAASSLTAAFDLDTAVGAQLDTVGAWVGVSRYLKTAVAGVVYFSWDTPSKGWDQGYWKPPFASGTDTATLDDTAYRAAIRLRILTNTWDGTTGAYTARSILLESAIPNVITYADNADKTISVRVTGPTVSAFLRTVITQAELLPRPVGMSITSITYA